MASPGFGAPLIGLKKFYYAAELGTGALESRQCFASEVGTGALESRHSYASELGAGSLESSVW